jgi:hypothetical protein
MALFNINVRTVLKADRVNFKVLVFPAIFHLDRHIVSATVSLNGLILNRMRMTPSMAKSAYFSVRFKGFINDKYEVVCVDNLGDSYHKKGKITKS